MVAFDLMAGEWRTWCTETRRRRGTTGPGIGTPHL